MVETLVLIHLAALPGELHAVRQRDTGGSMKQRTTSFPLNQGPSSGPGFNVDVLTDAGTRVVDGSCFAKVSVRRLSFATDTISRYLP